MKRGFTLIELLVVISIIGILSAAVLSALNAARGKAFDAKRLNDMHQIQIALELYFNAHNAYPPSNTLGCSGWESTGADAINDNFVAALVSDGDLRPGVHDPVPALENSCGNYAYFRYGPGGFSCDAGRGSFYILGIRSTYANGVAKYATSPGFSCPTRDWQTEFGWVTGNYSN
jgi:prepilin-type N-terminal cleavage/methylation domain-containing protein